MPNTVDYIGETLVHTDDSRTDTALLAKEGKIVGLYFSAHWCGPCRGFTPKLQEFYTKHKDNHKFEIVFISSDKDEESFKEYFADMPWPALPFGERDRKAKLCKKFKVQGIPFLVFLDAQTGKVITTDGRNNVLDDPEAKNFPWYPQPLSEILAGPLKNSFGEIDCDEALKNKVTALYFSAHWCPPCRGFTPTLIEAYKKLRDQGSNFEVVFISSDRSEESFNDYFSTMPWTAIPYGDPRTQKLTKHFGVQGIPTLILLNENNEIITTNGRLVLTKDPEAKEFPWPPKPLEELNDITAPALNESACVIYFTDGEEQNMAAARELLQDSAQKYTEEQKQSKNTEGELPELAFLYEGPEAEEIADSLRGFADLEESVPLVVILDIPEQRVYLLPANQLNPEGVQEMITAFKTDKLPFRPLRS